MGRVPGTAAVKGGARRPPKAPAALLLSYELPPHCHPRPQQEGQLHRSLLRVQAQEQVMKAEAGQAR